MGLLEDAIREHLELKRLRGADPAEVAREQQEVLDPPAGTASGQAAPDDAVADAYPTAGDAQAPDEATIARDDPGTADAIPRAAEVTPVGEETAELDMEAVLAQQPAAAGEPADPPSLAQGRIPTELTEEDSLEWEVPARSHDADVSSPREDEAGGAGLAEQPHAGPPDEPEDRPAEAEQNAPDQRRLSF
jgi:hypothetical protein